jgi:hypothetical protein
VSAVSSRSLQSLLLVASAFAATIPAQERAKTDDVAKIRAQLASDDLAAIAWGGVNTARHEVADVATDVEHALARVADRTSSSERELCAAALLHALIVLDAAPDPATVQTWWESAPPLRATVLVLLARRVRESFDFLLAASRTEIDALEFAAVCNLLLQADRKRFALACAEDLRFHVCVCVGDDDSFFPLASGIGCSVSAPVPGFPAIARYRLEAYEPGAKPRAFAPGPTSIHFSRTQRAPEWFFNSCSNFGPGHERWLITERNDYRLRCLKQCLAPLLYVGPEVATELEHRWVDESTYRTAVETELLRIRREWSNLLTLLKRKYAELADPRFRLPVVELEVVDKRSDRAVPLPRFELRVR